MNKAPAPEPLLCAISSPPQSAEESACGPVTARKDNVEEKQVTSWCAEETSFSTKLYSSLLWALEIILGLHRRVRDRERF